MGMQSPSLDLLALPCIHSLPFAISSFSPDAEVGALNPGHQQFVQTIQESTSSRETHCPSRASSSDKDFNCQKPTTLMQIEAKLKICSLLLLVPRVPCWGIFKWLSSSEAKAERGDRWTHAFSQGFLRTVLVESASAHPRGRGELHS